jgi:TonB family protein
VAVAFCVSLAIHALALAIPIAFLNSNALIAETGTSSTRARQLNVMALPRPNLYLAEAKSEFSTKVLPSSGLKISNHAPAELPSPTPETNDKPQRPDDRGPRSTTYLLASELDVRPLIQRHIMPLYPEHLPPGIRGVSLVSILINANGRVDDVRLKLSSGQSAFDDAAIEAFRHARYRAGELNGRFVPAELTVEVFFGAQPAPAEITKK